LINNRQGGRRRGRGGGGGRAPNMNPSAGNRQDNRQRGNAAQLLEKYKGLARDMQMQGDRVQTEYYLQFADHYYRLLNENRARFEEQRKQRGENDYDSSYDDEDQDQDELDGASDPRDSQDGDGQDSDRPEVRQAAPRRDDRRPGNGEFRQRRPRGRRDEGEPYGEARDEGDHDERIAADILPPSTSANVEDSAEEEAPRTPRRRTRRPRDPNEEIAPAA
jgi:hypothetical protein